jgi:hypothetical protein
MKKQRTRGNKRVHGMTLFRIGILLSMNENKKLSDRTSIE